MEEDNSGGGRKSRQRRRGAAGARIDAARERLEGLSGIEVESVPAVEKSNDGWTVPLEALGLRRIPDTVILLAAWSWTRTANPPATSGGTATREGGRTLVDLVTDRRIGRRGRRAGAMGPLKTIPTAPAAPIRFVDRTARQVVETAEREYYNPSVLKRRLAELSEQVDSGEINEAKFDAREDELLDRLEEAEKLHNGQ